MKRSAILLAAAVILLGAVLSYASSWHESLIIDEVPHIGAGYSYVKKADMRMNPEHPPLVKDLAGIALLALPLKQGAFDSADWQKGVDGEWNFGRSLIFNTTGNDADKIRFVARLPMLLFFILGGTAVFVWTQKIYGRLGSFIAVVLYSLSTTILSHAHFVTTDVPALTGVLVSSYLFIKYLKNQTGKNLWWAGIGLGFALLTKFSTVLLVPYFFILAIVGYAVFLKTAGSRPISGTIKITLIAIFLIVSPVYFLNTFNYPIQKQIQDTKTFLAIYPNKVPVKIIETLSGVPVVRALAYYGAGVLMAEDRAARGGGTIFFLGKVYSTALRGYFPFVYLIKEPIAWLFLVVVAIVWFISRAIKSDWAKDKKTWAVNHFDELALGLWLAVYIFISVIGGLNIGIRHLLPIYGAAIILVSGAMVNIINAAKNRSAALGKITVTAIFVIIGFYALENFRAYPNYLSYFNQFISGTANASPEKNSVSNGASNYVVDSNLDWGQDLIRFSDWVKGQDIKKIEFDYFGWADPHYYLGDRYIWTYSKKYKDVADFIKNNQSDGWLAVSATSLRGSYGTDKNPSKPNYRWLDIYKPVANIGGSIFVYRIEK
ncbi:MAG: hypothetical protein CEN90_48 [Parcubacteria group bacterium Licking1014_17]|nr:MAG: hypothetical protein CEN90_48 [Parcubacteria group bacterium Licking1014_17]